MNDRVDLAAVYCLSANNRGEPWKVESASTRDLMNFYPGLSSPPQAGRGKATKTEALRLAALKVMKNPGTSHPFYWAGLVLVGDGR